MLLYIPLLQVQVAAKRASLPIDMLFCCCWSYVLLALVVCSNPADLRLQQALTRTTKERGHLIPGGSWRRLCAAWTLWMQIGAQSGHSRRLPLCSLPWWGRDTWGLNHVKAGQDLLGGRHSLGAPPTYQASQPCPVITSQTGLISHTILGLAAKIFLAVYSIEVVSGHTYI